MKDDFNFDDFDLDSFNENGSNKNQSSNDTVNSDAFDTGLDDSFASDDECNTPVKKNSFIGIVLLAIAFMVVILLAIKFFQGISAKQQESANNKTQDVVDTSNQTDNTLSSDSTNNNRITTETPSVTEEVKETQNNKVDNNKLNLDNWVDFDSDSNLKFSNEYLDLTFTVTSINNKAKMASDNEVEVKTILRGSISGYLGVYELDVPYIKGKLLKVGDSFSVQAKVAKTQDGKKVIGELKY